MFLFFPSHLEAEEISLYIFIRPWMGSSSGACSAQQVKHGKFSAQISREKPSRAVVRIWWIFHVFVFVFIFWKQTFLYCCCFVEMFGAAVTETEAKGAEFTRQASWISKVYILLLFFISPKKQKQMWRKMFSTSFGGPSGRVFWSGKFSSDLQIHRLAMKSFTTFGWISGNATNTR